MALVTLAEVKQALRMAENTDDDRIDELILAVQAYAETRCRRKFDQNGSLQEIIDVLGVGGVTIRVNRPPINSIANVYVSTDVPRVYDSTTALDSDDFLFDADAGLIHRLDGRVFPADVHAVRVDYDGGFATIPEDLKRATISAIASILQKDKAKIHHLTSQVGPGDGSIGGIRYDDIPLTAREIFDLYALDTAG